MMVYWRFKRDTPSPWRFGFMIQLNNGLVRMGLWNGDTYHGPVVDLDEIELKEYSR